MLKLTAEQIEKLGDCFFEREDILVGYRPKVVEMLKLYHAMLADSPTHRVVEAPEGYEFDPSIANMLAKRLDYPFIQVAIKPIPKPCPSPVLEPVTVTVEQRYPEGYKIPEGWEAKFGKNGQLQEQGFTHYLSTSFDMTREWVESTWISPEVSIIGLRKWEGK